MTGFSRYRAFLISAVLPAGLICFLGSLTWLSFFNHPHTDDFILVNHIRQYTNGGYIPMLYNTWSGRFLSMTLGILGARNEFFLNNYWFHSLALLASYIIAAYYLACTVSKYILRTQCGQALLWMLACNYVCVQFSSVPELASSLYWFSSAVSYQPAIILLHFQLAFVIRMIASPRNKIIYCLLTMIALVLGNFNNEVAVMINFFFLIPLFIVAWKSGNRSYLVIISVAYLISAFVTITAPGNQARSSGIPLANPITALAVSAGRTFIASWNVLSNPLFIIVGLATFYAGNQLRKNIHPSIFKVTGGYLILPFGFLSAFLILLPVMVVSNGSLPERAANVVVQFLVLTLLPGLFLIGARSSYLNIPRAPRSCILLIIGAWLFFNPAFGILVRSCLSAPLYKKTHAARVEKMRISSRAHDAVFTTRDFDTIRDSIMLTDYPHTRMQVGQWMKQNPPAIFMMDDFQDTATAGPLLRYYGFQRLRIIEHP